MLGCIAQATHSGESLSKRRPEEKPANHYSCIRGPLARTEGKTAMTSRALLILTFFGSLWFSTFENVALGQVGRETGTPADMTSLRQQAEASDARAANMLGWDYMLGKHVPQDYAKAANWYRRAVDSGLPDSEFALGFLYEQGMGVGRDYHQAMVYYRAAATHGHATAANNLASMYEHGEGVEKDPTEAAHWYQTAAERGDVTAQCRILHPCIFAESEWAGITARQRSGFGLLLSGDLRPLRTIFLPFTTRELG